MGRFTIMLIPEGAQEVKQYTVSKKLLKLVVVGFGLLFFSFGFMAFEYFDLIKIKNDYKTAKSESQHLKGEAKVLIANLTEVKKSLSQIQGYTNQLNELMSYKIKSFSKQVGIGPLSPEEYSKANLNRITSETTQNPISIPVGLDINKLQFKPALESLADIGLIAENQALELQHILSTLSKKKSLLDSIPTIKPVNGWLASTFGKRTSPFTGDIGMHNGVDIAAEVGTPIYAPADGVVIYEGTQDGFGNTILIAHSQGIVTRYAHAAQNLVTAGQKITKGDQIATVGLTGRTTGPHLHYEVWVNGNVANPNKFILGQY